MSEERESGTLASGTIKWFDPGKGYGFVVNDDGGQDILLHANVLRNFGQGSVADGSRVTVRIAPTGRGLQATEVIAIEPPASQGEPPIPDIDKSILDQLESLPLRPARVKWFDKQKGFGFANVFGHPDDLFLHIEVVRRSGFADLATGEAIALRAIEGPRGLMAAQICAWDRSAQSSESLQLSCATTDDFLITEFGSLAQ